MFELCSEWLVMTAAAGWFTGMVRDIIWLWQWYTRG